MNIQEEINPIRVSAYREDAVGITLSVQDNTLVGIFEMKKCTKCGKTKPLSDFYEYKSNRDGHYTSCKKCECNRRLKYKRTMRGLIGSMYSGQKSFSKKRNHNPPSYTFDEFYGWILSQQIFVTLYNEWIKSNYNKWLIPSCDRMDNSIGYSLNNIQLVTWRENNDNYRNGIIYGNEKFTCKRVARSNVDGTNTKIYDSVAIAAREFGVFHGHIAACCRGERQAREINTAGS